VSSSAFEKAKSVEGQLDRKRLECALAKQPLVLPPSEETVRNQPALPWVEHFYRVKFLSRVELSLMI
jgi:hypothetical protein